MWQILLRHKEEKPEERLRSGRIQPMVESAGIPRQRVLVGALLGMLPVPLLSQLEQAA